MDHRTALPRRSAGAPGARSQGSLSSDVSELEELMRTADPLRAERIYERLLRMRRVLAKLDNQMRVREAIQEVPGN